MKVDELKYVVGEAQEAKPVYMRFYGKIDEESTRNFNDEFLWIQDYVKPSKIIISINSEGGSVLYGMGTFSIIQQCPIEVETIVEGLAASMASVLWAAGTRSYMRDYSILMIHNPFIRDEKSCNPDNEQIVNAFQKQIETIYHKRFGLTKAKVREIMDGKEGCDGTYFDAKSAVNAGILSAECVLKTSKQVCNKVKDQIEGVVEANALQKIMASINTELGNFKPLDDSSSIPNQNQIENSNSQKTMDKEQEFAFGSVCAQLGLEKTSEVSAVITRIDALKNAENKAAEIQASYNALKIQKEGLDAQLTNVQNELTTVKNELKSYKDAEEAKEAEAPVTTGYKVLAVTACPTGIAHTFMAAENLTKAGEKLGYPLKAETNGSEGIGNALTADEIKACDGIIVAADKNVEMARFDGKPVLIVPVTEGIRHPEELINKIKL